MTTPTPPARTGSITPLAPRRTSASPGPALRWAAATASPALQGTLALDPARAEPDAQQRLSVAPCPGGSGAASADGDLQARAGRFLQAVVEILGADRPVTQLLRWATSDVYAQVCRLADTAAGGSGASGCRTGRPRVVSVHVKRPASEVAEVAAHVRHAGRSRALAARLEHRGDRWVCTALQVG